jgi:PAS domain S-box-containing protein
MARSLNSARTLDDIYTAAMDAVEGGLGVDGSSILLIDDDGVMRVKATRGLTEGNRSAVEAYPGGLTDSADPRSFIADEVAEDSALTSLGQILAVERMAALAWIPLVARGPSIGKLLLYYAAPRALTPDEIDLASVVASQVTFAVERMRAEARSRHSEERLRFALDAAHMGTWDWDVGANTIQWSDNLASIHGLPSETFDGAFASYEREIHPEDRARVLASIRRAVEEDVPHDVEYRIVAPDGSVRWVEGKGRVKRDEAGRATHMRGVCMVVTRRKEAELARLAAAEEASRLKEEFLATLSHELRTPLNAIVGWVQMLQRGEVDADRTRQAIEIIGRNARLQRQLIADILDVSRIITGKLQLERAPVLIASLVDTVVSGMLPLARTSGVRLEASLDTALPPIDADAKRVEQVLINVIGNAVKFTPAGGRVTIRASAGHDGIVIVVADTGAGIEPAFLPFIFERFRQADSRTTRQHGGLGLGLAIARHLVEEHGGEIDIESAGAGQGTTVRVRLPIGGGAAARLPLVRTLDGTPEAPSALDLTGATILVVDDHGDSRELLTVLFEQAGASVVSCESAATALHAIDRVQPALVVADIAMPEVDGYQLMAAIGRRWPRVPAVALSAYTRPEDRRKALAAGFKSYCPKPFDPGDLWRAVALALA